MATGERAGEVVHVFDKIMVAVVRLTKSVRQGDHLHFLGRHTDFEQEITSMQVEHQAVESAAAGSEVAVKLSQAARRGDAVYLLKE
jgi:selenocysteine-specific translation elongation factor